MRFTLEQGLSRRARLGLRVPPACLADGEDVAVPADRDIGDAARRSPERHRPASLLSKLRSRLPTSDVMFY